MKWRTLGSRTRGDSLDLLVTTAMASLAGISAKHGAMSIQDVTTHASDRQIVEILALAVGEPTPAKLSMIAEDYRVCFRQDCVARNQIA